MDALELLEPAAVLADQFSQVPGLKRVSVRAPADLATVKHYDQREYPCIRKLAAALRVSNVPAKVEIEQYYAVLEHAARGDQA